MPEIAAEINSTRQISKYIVAPGDKLEITFRDAPERNHSVDVQADGWATFSGIDSIEVVGLSLQSLDERLTDAYDKVLTNPDLTLHPRALGRRTVMVMGEVKNQGPVEIDLDGRLTLVEALGKAGGVDKNTGHISSTVLVRWDNIQNRQLAWTFDARPHYWSQGEPIYLQPLDLVFVPNTPIDDVGIWVDMYFRRLIPFPRIFYQ